MSESDDLIDRIQPRMFDVAATPHVLSLAERFTCPPFTQLDGRSGWWQERKRRWLELGLNSGEGRTARFIAEGVRNDPVGLKLLAISDGQSIFDPVLCELAYRWFVPVGGSVLDPFAGGSVRGIVAAVLGRRYVGVDLSADQVAANYRQLEVIRETGVITPGCDPVWIVGDSSEVVADLQLYQSGRSIPLVFDFVWSCPPYHDLEKYSDDPADLSNMSWDGFRSLYGAIIEAAVDRLSYDRFAAFVVGEIRGPDGLYRNFVQETIGAFERAGAAYYNEAFLVTPAGTLPLRAAKQFVVSRKLGRTHQSLLVFVKGDPRVAAVACDPGVMDYMGETIDETDEDYSGVGHG